MRVYIAGPIAGYVDGNKTAFDRAEEKIINDKRFVSCVYNNHSPSQSSYAKASVINPVTMSIRAGDFNIIKPTPDQRRIFVRRDIDAILSCEAIYMLNGWERSIGARAEHSLAVWIGLEIFYEST